MLLLLFLAGMLLSLWIGIYIGLGIHDDME
jgi:hypothetical protein